MGGNTFYSNAEAYAFEVLQQKMIKEAQRAAQQTVMELSALKSFLAQGQFVYCIPLGGICPPCIPTPLPFCPTPPQEINMMPEQHNLPALPPSSPQPPPCSSSSPTPSPPALPPPSPPCSPQSTVNVNIKNAQVKLATNKPGSDECNLGKDGVDVIIDLREFLPATICLNVDEKILEIKVNHINAQGSRSFARRYDLPACISLDSVKCILTHDGFLMFSALWCKME